MTHDTSRHTVRADVICSECGRRLRGAMDSRGRWAVLRHKQPDGKPCWGHRFNRHSVAPCPMCGVRHGLTDACTI